MKDGKVVVSWMSLGSSGVGEGGTSDMHAFMWRSHCVIVLCGGMGLVSVGGVGVVGWCWVRAMIGDCASGGWLCVA
eukprot:7682031-Alexandrium_andersonii.AAC.1